MCRGNGVRGKSTSPSGNSGNSGCGIVLLWLLCPQPMQIEGSVVLITGASQGIGAACAAAFRSRGAKLALLARNEERLRAVAKGDELVLAGDVTDAEFRAEAVDRTLQAHGAIDVLINNAGTGLYAPAWSASETQVRELFELNLFAPLALSQLVVPGMRQRGRGMLVNISSIAGEITLPWLTLYSTTKHALCSLPDGFRMELEREWSARDDRLP